MNFCLLHPHLWCKIMKITFSQLIIIILMTGMSYSKPTSAQEILDKKISFNVQDRSLGDVLKLLAKRHRIEFIYSQHVIQSNDMISANFDNQSVKQVLDKLLSQYHISYKVFKTKVILVDDHSELAPSIIRDNIAIEVTGKVTDEKNLPLPGVTVSVKGMKERNTVTDNEGGFKISLTENTILVFSYVGYQSQEVMAAPGKPLNITLRSEQSNLNDVVVVGYGTQRKVNLTGAVDQISSEQLQNRPINNLGAGLQGLIPNLNITIPDGSPDGTADFNIRGFTSINGGSPLILVDNISLTAQEVARIDPADIESVTVLKDAASAAIYGGRASFGVILITTKRAKSKDVSVGLSANVAYRSIGKMPELVTDPYTVMDMKNTAGIPLYNLFPESVRGYARERSADPSLPDVIINPGNKRSWAYYGNTDWIDEAYNKSAPTTTINASIGKNAENINYLFSAGYYHQDGLLRFGTDIYSRYNLRSKVDLKINKWLSLANNTTLTNNETDRPVYMIANADFFSLINRQSPLDVPKNPDGSWTAVGAASLGRLQEGGRAIKKINEFQTTTSVNASLIKNMWSIKGDLSFRRTSGKTNSYDFPIAYKTGPEIPLYTASTSYAQIRNDQAQYDVINLYTDFHKQLGNHYFQVLAGYNQEYRKDDFFTAYNTNLVSNSFPTVQLSTGNATTTEGIGDWAVQGLFYRVNYNYRNRYLVEFNGRYDGSSRFTEKDRWGFFPSASAGWLLSEESFFKPLKNIFNLVKIRGSYGSLGNQYTASNYPYIATMSRTTIGQVLGTTKPITVNPPGAVADSFTWENVSTVNLGIDLTMLKNRLGVTYDRYTRFTKDMITKGVTLPGVFGTSPPSLNAADLKTKGWELRLSWRDKGDLMGSPFFYNVAVAVSDSRSVITKYDNPTGLLSDYYVGRELGEIWGMRTEGFFQNAQDLATHANQTTVGSTNQNYKFYVGDLKFADLNGDGKIDFGKNTLNDPGDQLIVGNTTKRYPYSIDLSGGWKNFDIRMYLQGIGKRDWYPPAANTYFWGVYSQPWTNITTQNLDFWTPDNPGAYFPALRAYAAERANQVLGIPNERYLQDASYLRVKNITLGYTLPKNLSKKLRMNNVHFYVSGENLFEISHLKVKMDPEGLDGFIYPFQRTYSFGLNVGF